MMKRLRRIVLQDSAYMLEKYPERANHAVFGLPLFQTPEFAEFRVKMREHVLASVSPLDATVDDVLPGVREQLATQSRATESLRDELSQLRVESRVAWNSVDTKIGQFETSIHGGINTIGEAFVTTGNVPCCLTVVC